MSSLRRSSSIAVLLLSLTWAAGQGAQDEESEDHYKRWLEQDVAYIISDEEKEIFLQLSSEEERQRFIEAFWLRRDPNQLTPVNEFKEEHYRRIAFANERFSAGKAGWKTDRGRIYIAFGQPDEIESNPTGTTLSDHRGGVARAMESGPDRGVLPREVVTFPFEIWRYRYIEGIGSNVRIEFVDRTGSGLYHLARDAEDKNVFAYKDPSTDPTSVAQSEAFKRARDRTFSRTELAAKLASPPAIKFRDLQQAVSSRIRYEQILFEAEFSQLRVTDSSFYVPITFSLPTRKLHFKPNGDVHQAQVNIFMQATNLQKRIVEVREDTLTLQGADPAQLKRGSALYSQRLLLPPGRYVVDLVVKDVHSAKIGAKQELVIIKAPSSTEGPTLSSIILADVMRPVRAQETSADPFVIGGHKVIPNVGRRFHPKNQLGIFFQIYGLRFDQASGDPDVRLRIRFSRDGETLMTLEDDLSRFGHLRGETCAVTLSVPLGKFPLGEIEAEVLVADRLADAEALSAVKFAIADSPTG